MAFTASHSCSRAGRRNSSDGVCRDAPTTQHCREQRPMTVLHRNFIGGQAVGVETGDRIKVYNPARDTVLSEIPDTPADMVDRAVQAAKKAQKSWAKLPAIQRANALRRISAKIRENADKIAHVISEEQGKVLPLAKVEAAFTADYLDYMAEWARRIEGEI